MNIWIINHYALPPSMPGGTRHYSLGRELVKKGHSVTIIASSFHYSCCKEAILNKGEVFRVEDHEGVRFLWIKTPSYSGNSLARLWNMVVFTFRVWRRIGQYLLAEPDVIIGSSVHLLAPLAAERLAKYYRVPFVLEIRDIWPQTLVDTGAFSERHLLIQLFSHLERFLYQRAERIINVLPKANEYMASLGIPQSKIIWIPNGIDLNMSSEPSKPETRDVFIVMYAGAHGHANNLECALQAAYLLEQEGWAAKINFHFVGDGPRKSYLEALARNLKLTSVKFYPPVPKSEIYELLKSADAFLMILSDLPVFKYGISPNKLADYLSMARPIIYAVNSLYDPITENHAGLALDKIGPEPLAQAAKQLALMSPEERWDMGCRGREYVTSVHDVRVLANQLETLLNDTLSHKDA